MGSWTARTTTPLLPGYAYNETVCERASGNNDVSETETRPEGRADYCAHIEFLCPYWAEIERLVRTQQLHNDLDRRLSTPAK